MARRFVRASCLFSPRNFQFQANGYRHAGSCRILISRHQSCMRNTNTLDEDEIRTWLEKFPGGSVDLKKSENSGIAYVRLNNPEKKNALSGQMIVGLRDVVTELEKWKNGKGLILFGADNFFCAGGDLKSTMKHMMTPEDGNKMSYYMTNTLTRFQNLPFISLALIQGKALGGGAEIITACDFRLAVPSAVIGFIHIKLGVVPGWGGVSRLCQIVPRTVAIDLLATGKLLSAQQACNAGLVQEVLPECEETEALEHATMWLGKYIHNSDPEPIRAMKNMISHAYNYDMDMSQEKARQDFASVWGGPTHTAKIKQNKISKS